MMMIPTATAFLVAVPSDPAGSSKWDAGGMGCAKRGVNMLKKGRHVSLRMADPWDLTPGRKAEQSSMFNMPRRNESKMSEATETLRRDFKAQMAESQALPGFLRGAMDPLRLKRNVKESRVAYLSRMFQG